MRKTIRDLMAGGIPAAAAEACGWTLKYGLAATGASQATAAALTATVNVVTSATGSTADGVLLPPAPKSYGDGADICIIINESGAALGVWPNTDDAIDDGAANAEATLADNAVAFYIGYYNGSTGHWTELEV